MSVHRICLPLLVAAAMSGCCHSFGPLVKRDSELNCPTDIRRTVPWCMGEDAIFRCPCGPADDFYGHKPTCWRTWPAPATVWRDSYCGTQPCGTVTTASEGPVEMMVLPSTDEPVDEGVEPPTLEELPPTSSVSEPHAPNGLDGQGRPLTAQSAPQGLPPRMTASYVAAPALSPRSFAGAVSESLAPRQAAGVAPEVLAPRRTPTGAPAPLPPRSKTPDTVHIPAAPQFSVNRAGYLRGTDAGEALESPVVDQVAHIETVPAGSSAIENPSLTVVELPPAVDQQAAEAPPQSRRRSLLDAFISPADEDGGEEAQPHNWNLVR